MKFMKEIKWRIREAKATALKQKILIGYVAKMLMMPKGTMFEINGMPVGRMAYIADTVKILRQM